MSYDRRFCRQVRQKAFFDERQSKYPVFRRKFVLKRLTLYSSLRTRLRQLSRGLADCAPVHPPGLRLRSTTIAVADAGWTELVIPRGYRLLCDLFVDRSPVNILTSLDCIRDVAFPGGSLPIHRCDHAPVVSGGVSANPFHLGHNRESREPFEGFSKLGRISCPNNNEVML